MTTRLPPTHDEAVSEGWSAKAGFQQRLDELCAERDAALAREAALAEVLDVINRSAGDPHPVFEAVLEKAVRLCESAFGTIHTYDGEYLHTEAMRGVAPAMAEILREPIRPSPGTGIYRIAQGEDVVHFLDIVDDPAYRSGSPLRRALADLTGARSQLVIALRKNGVLRGMLMIYLRTELRPFTDGHIALLQNFDAQAVIAMENARLLTEQREALEQQTATAEVLQVINASPGDLSPVFDAMLEKALHLCGAAFGVLWTYDGQRVQAVALRGLPPVFAEYLTRASHPVAPENAHGRLLHGESVVHIADVREDQAYESGDSIRRNLVELGGGRTLLAVPLRRDDIFVGDFVIYRLEVRPFSDKQIALLQNFAAQAVIAMENARLLGDLRQRTSDLQESLEYQTATSDVLKVISRSAFDLNTVLQTVLASAVSLCRAERAILYRYRDGRCHFEVGHNNLPEYKEFERTTPIASGPDTLVGRTMQEGEAVQILDAFQDPDYSPKNQAQINSARSMLGVPLLRDGELIGVFALARTVVEPFSDRQIELVTTFADQAVIAIENARLLGELRTRTDELSQRQSELRVTFENMGDGVAMFDDTRRLAAWNRKFQEMFDVPDRLLEEHRTYAEYIRYLAERGDYYPEVDPEEQIRRLTENASRHYVYERTRPDGRVIEIRQNPVPSGGFVMIFSDVTERKRNESELRTARDAAEAAYRELKAAQANLIQAEKMASLGQLTAGIAHEIKNPLNFVNNFSILSVELLNELKQGVAPVLPALDADRRAEIDETLGMLTSNLEKITEHGRRADGIVRSMLEHSRTGSGERRRVDLNTLVEEALNLAYHGARAQDQSFNITLERDLADGIAPVELVPQDVTRVLLNLVSNGFYAARKRQRIEAVSGFEPRLKVRTLDLGDAVEVQVRDNGIGIPIEIRDKLFQPFFTTKPTGEGTGLGLSISYDIVMREHGGSITVDSQVNEYSEFTIRLPRNRMAIG